MKSEKEPQVHIGIDSNGKSTAENRKPIPPGMSWEEYQANVNHNKNIRGKAFDNWNEWKKENE